MKKVFIDVHKALHNPKQKHIKIGGIPRAIQLKPNGLRYLILYHDNRQWEVVQQDPNTRSSYAVRAKDGERISWLIPLYYDLRMATGWKVITDSTHIEE